jgi:CHAD domain-containing protein
MARAGVTGRRRRVWKALHRLGGQAAVPRRWRWRTALARRLSRRASALRDRIREAGSLYAPEALHRTRVATKKLRYALEVADETGAAPCRQEVRTLKRTQDGLGHLHDLQVLEIHVRDADARAPGQSRGQARSLEALSRAVDRECRALHARYVALAPKAAAVRPRSVADRCRPRVSRRRRETDADQDDADSASAEPAVAKLCGV